MILMVLKVLIKCRLTKLLRIIAVFQLVWFNLLDNVRFTLAHNSFGSPDLAQSNRNVIITMASSFRHECRNISYEVIDRKQISNSHDSFEYLKLKIARILCILSTLSHTNLMKELQLISVEINFPVKSNFVANSSNLEYTSYYLHGLEPLVFGALNPLIKLVMILMTVGYLNYDYYFQGGKATFYTIFDIINPVKANGIENLSRLCAQSSKPSKYREEMEFLCDILFGIQEAIYIHLENILSELKKFKILIPLTDIYTTDYSSIYNELANSHDVTPTFLNSISFIEDLAFLCGYQRSDFDYSRLSHPLRHADVLLNFFWYDSRCTKIDKCGKKRSFIKDFDQRLKQIQKIISTKDPQKYDPRVEMVQAMSNRKFESSSTIEEGTDTKSPREYLEHLLTMYFEKLEPDTFQLVVRGKMRIDLLNSLILNPMHLIEIIIFQYLSVADYRSAMNSLKAGSFKVPMSVKVSTSNNFFNTGTLRGVFDLLNIVGSSKAKKKAVDAVRSFVDDNLILDALNIIGFLSHTSALLYINPIFESDKSERVTQKLDDIIKRWSDDGFSELKNDEFYNTQDFSIPRNPNIEEIFWKTELIDIIINRMSNVLRNNNNQRTYVIGDIARRTLFDSLNMLKYFRNEAYCLGMVLEPEEKLPILNRLQQSAKGFANFIIGRSTTSKNKLTVWLCFKIDFDKLKYLAEELHKLWQSISDTKLKNFLTEAFLELVQEKIDSHKSNFIDTNSVNILIPDFYYDIMNSSSRQIAMNRSMHKVFGVKILRMLLALVEVNLRNPHHLVDMEKRFSKDEIIKNINDPTLINSFRIALKSDIASHYANKILPKTMKKMLKGITDGKAFWFSNLMHISGAINEKFGLQYIGHTLKTQAIYFGNFLVTFEQRRLEARRAMIFSALSLASLGLYTFISFENILSQTINSGGLPSDGIFSSPQFYWDSIPIDSSTNLSSASEYMKSSFALAAMNVFKVGLFGAIAPIAWYATLPSAVYLILRGQFKSILRLEMIVEDKMKQILTKIKNTKFVRKIISLWRNKDSKVGKNIDEDSGCNVSLTTSMLEEILAEEESALKSNSPTGANHWGMIPDCLLNQEK